MHRLQELIRLHRQGRRGRGLARTLKMGRDTVRTYSKALSEAGLLEGDTDAALPDLEVVKAAVREHLPVRQPPQQSSSVEAWREVITGLWEKGAGPTAIFDRLRLEHEDFPGSLSAIKRLCLRLQRKRGVRPEDVVIPVDTAPGEVAYVDFGYAGKRYDPERGVLRKSWIFVMVLGFSRHMVSLLCFDQKVDTWIRLHIEAFRRLGGVPRVIVPDNLKSAVIRAAFGLEKDPVLNRSYRELARHYGFLIEPTRPRTPQHKGKVESAVKYVNNNGLKTMVSVDLHQDQKELDRWVQKIAGRRRHGTTSQPPLQVFEEVERATLLPLPRRHYELVTWKKVTLHRDCHVQIDGAFYSAPWPLIGQVFWARCTPYAITLYHQDERSAWHRRVPRGKRSTRDEHLPDHRADLRHRSRSHWESRAIKVGPFTRRLIAAVFDADDVLSRLRQVQAIVTHLEGFPRERAEGAARRALHFGVTRYVDVRNILKKGLDLEPLPNGESRPWSKNSRFARKPSERGLFPESPEGDDKWPSKMN